MNKLLVSNIINLASGFYNLEFNNKKATINITGNVCIYILNSNIEEIVINLDDNSILNVYKYDKLLKYLDYKAYDILLNYLRPT